MEIWLHSFRLAASCSTPGGFLPGLYDNISCSANGTPVINHISDLLVIIGNLVRILIAASGALAVIALLAASIFYIISMGDPGRIKRAKEIIQYAATGIVLITVAYVLITYIASNF